ncbi:CPBP family intramembrane metalloprotease [Pedobacter sp. MR2016-19]|uniref:CPBP family intramembrane glutamic endopeptidase n=1 Tax=unclassified Pedobacter TaxID=2628915 RepID=UPI001874BB03|nr:MULTISPECIES: CPBP family intramembrane glutamic endopeptidase [unclassified Pedobacter]MBE5318982.1 CPBP family intramembrane metalloprotease [Pedobacter sp. MR2016-19]QXU40499.1 CPBP family intramembrane metalloprotease [Pedobacter sp. D749]
MENPIIFIVIFSCFLLGISFLYDYFIELIESKFGVEIVYNNRIDHKTLPYKLILSCFLAPLIETYFFQKAPYDILKRRNSKKWVIILVSSLLFGLIHFSSFAYILYGFLAGTVLIMAYLCWEGRRLNKFVIVCIIHMLHNLFVLCGDLINLK